MIAELPRARPLRRDEMPLTLAREFAEQLSLQTAAGASEVAGPLGILAACHVSGDARCARGSKNGCDAQTAASSTTWLSRSRRGF